MTPRFIYFDLGNVLLKFDDHRSCRQMGEVAGIPGEKVWQAIFGGDLKARYEAGEIDDRQFHEILCQATGVDAPFEALRAAGCDIFEPNVSIFPVVSGLSAAGYRLGILSNTCPAHWNFCHATYALLRNTFDVYGLSYELKASKPSAEIYARAAELCGVAPQGILFADDMPANVAGAREAGWDAIQYTGTPALVAELRKRGLEFNY